MFDIHVGNYLEMLITGADRNANQSVNRYCRQQVQSCNPAVDGFRRKRVSYLDKIHWCSVSNSYHIISLFGAILVRVQYHYFHNIFKTVISVAITTSALT